MRLHQHLLLAHERLFLGQFLLIFEFLFFTLDLIVNAVFLGYSHYFIEAGLQDSHLFFLGLFEILELLFLLPQLSDSLAHDFEFLGSVVDLLHVVWLPIINDPIHLSFTPKLLHFKIFLLFLQSLDG